MVSSALVLGEPLHHLTVFGREEVVYDLAVEHPIMPHRRDIAAIEYKTQIRQWLAVVSTKLLGEEFGSQKLSAGQDMRMLDTVDAEYDANGIAAGGRRRTFRLVGGVENNLLFASSHGGCHLCLLSLTSLGVRRGLLQEGKKPTISKNPSSDLA